MVGNAELKARAGADTAGPDAFVIGCDTDVVLEGRVLGKAADAAAAAGHLRALSGRTHEVLSGVCVIRGDRANTARELTTVSFRELSASEIDAYVDSDEWEGRAGGYAVQGLGSTMVDGIDGDLSNVIGLPLPLVSTMLADLS